MLDGASLYSDLDSRYLKLGGDNANQTISINSQSIASVNRISFNRQSDDFQNLAYIEFLGSTNGLEIRQVSSVQPITIWTNNLKRLEIDSAGDFDFQTGSLTANNLLIGDGLVTSPHADYDDLVIEGVGRTGINILSPDANYSQIGFGSPSDTIGALIRWVPGSNSMAIGTTHTGGSIIVWVDNVVTALTISSGGNFDFQAGDLTTTGDISATNITGANADWDAAYSHVSSDGSSHADVATNTAASHAEAHNIESHPDTIVTGLQLNNTFSQVATNTAELITHGNEIDDNTTHRELTHDYAYISGNDAATDVTAAELEELSDGSETTLHSHAGGAGDVVGPAGATNNAVAIFDGTTGKLLKESVNADIVSYLGRTIIGHASYADSAVFSHYDMSGAGNFALLQTNVGETYLNAPTGRNLFFGIAYSPLMHMGPTGDFKVGGTIADARFEVETSATEGHQAVTIDQNDIDQAFIDFQGSSIGDLTRNISTCRGGGSIVGPQAASGSGNSGWLFCGCGAMLRMEIGGCSNWWIPVYRSYTLP